MDCLRSSSCHVDGQQLAGLLAPGVVLLSTSAGEGAATATPVGVTSLRGVRGISVSGPGSELPLPAAALPIP